MQAQERHTHLPKPNIHPMDSVYGTRLSVPLWASEDVKADYPVAICSVRH